MYCTKTSKLVFFLLFTFLINLSLSALPRYEFEITEDKIGEIGSFTYTSSASVELEAKCSIGPESKIDRTENTLVVVIREGYTDFECKKRKPAIVIFEESDDGTELNEVSLQDKKLI